MTTSQSAAGWHGLLDTGEDILWQGQPRASIIWADALRVQTLMGFFFAGFAIFWMSMASSITSGGNFPGPVRLFPLFGLPFLVIGLYQAVGHLFWDAYGRSRTY